MEVTTVKVQKKTKSALDEFREEQESYDDVIQKLVSTAKQKELKKRLIEGYQNIGRDELELLEEWEPASQEV